MGKEPFYPFSVRFPLTAFRVLNGLFERHQSDVTRADCDASRRKKTPPLLNEGPLKHAPSGKLLPCSRRAVRRRTVPGGLKAGGYARPPQPACAVQPALFSPQPDSRSRSPPETNAGD